MGDHGEPDLVKVGVVPQDVLKLLVLLLVVWTASGTAALVHGANELSVVGTCLEASIVSKWNGGVGLFETSVFDETRTGKRVGEEFGRAVNERAWRMTVVRAGDPRVIKCVESVSKMDTRGAAGDKVGDVGPE